MCTILCACIPVAQPDTKSVMSKRAPAFSYVGLLMKQALPFVQVRRSDLTLEEAFGARL